VHSMKMIFSRAYYVRGHLVPCATSNETANSSELGSRVSRLGSVTSEKGLTCLNRAVCRGLITHGGGVKAQSHCYGGQTRCTHISSSC
jgi:hypothetical protein